MTAPAIPNLDRITFDRAKMGGRACIRDLRITVGTVLSLLAEGVSHEEVPMRRLLALAFLVTLGVVAVAQSRRPAGTEHTGSAFRFNKVRDGVYHADEALPSERVLAEQLELSRVTARKAIDRLVEQGLIIRKRGSGNYIAPKLEQPLTRLTSFSEELHQRGFVPSSRWLLRGFTPAAPDEQLSLELKSGERVARLERLRLADQVVMAYELSVLPEAVMLRSWLCKPTAVLSPCSAPAVLLASSYFVSLRISVMRLLYEVTKSVIAFLTLSLSWPTVIVDCAGMMFTPLGSAGSLVPPLSRLIVRPSTAPSMLLVAELIARPLIVRFAFLAAVFCVIDTTEEAGS